MELSALGKSHGQKQSHNCLHSANWQLFRKDAQGTQCHGNQGKRIQITSAKASPVPHEALQGDVLANTPELHNELPESHTCPGRKHCRSATNDPKEAVANHPTSFADSY